MNDTTNRKTYKTVKGTDDLLYCDLSYKTILIVEDDFASTYLMQNGCTRATRLIHVREAGEALEICYNNRIDLMIMNSRLKGEMNGIELTRELRHKISICLS